MGELTNLLKDDKRTKLVARANTLRQASQNPIEYAKTVHRLEEMGAGYIPDQLFLEQGEAELLRSRREDLNLKEMEAERAEIEYWANVARVALTRFPELCRRERIHASEIKKRLGQIRKTGYPIQPYSEMSAEESWEYLKKVRSDIAKNTRTYCPYVLKEIDEDNEQRKRDSHL
jgi:hypothetical protein